MLIDTHCHLNFNAFKDDIDEVLFRANDEGVQKIIIPGAKIDSSQRAVEIADMYNNCFAAVGVHPHHADEVLKYEGIKVLKGKIDELAKNKKVVAIGEIGLDYHQYKSQNGEDVKITEENKQLQKKLLEMQIGIAQELNLPVILHCRDAYSDMLTFIGKYNLLKGIFHCFSGSLSDLEKILSMGFYVGFDGNITYNKPELLIEAVKKTPVDKLLIETDSPYLSPVPYRGVRNEPKNVKIIAECIAAVKNLTDEEIGKSTCLNSQKLFNL